MDDNTERSDPARLWRGLAIWPLIAGVAVVLVAVVLQPEDVGPTYLGPIYIIIVPAVVTVVIGCFGVARTSQSKVERWLFGIAGAAIIAAAALTLLMIVALAVAMCASSANCQ